MTHKPRVRSMSLYQMTFVFQTQLEKWKLYKKKREKEKKKKIVESDFCRNKYRKSGDKCRAT